MPSENTFTEPINGENAQRERERSKLEARVDARARVPAGSNHQLSKWRSTPAEASAVPGGEGRQAKEELLLAVDASNIET
jgi:hypothetical protein